MALRHTDPSNAPKCLCDHVTALLLESNKVGSRVMLPSGNKPIGKVKASKAHLFTYFLTFFLIKCYPYHCTTSNVCE